MAPTLDVGRRPEWGRAVSCQRGFVGGVLRRHVYHHLDAHQRLLPDGLLSKDAEGGGTALTTDEGCAFVCFELAWNLGLRECGGDLV